MNILFLYFGQPRMVEELIPNHDFIVKSLKDDYKINIDFHYSLWNKYHDYTTVPSPSSRNLGNNNLITIDEDYLINKIKENRESNVTYVFHNYDVAEDIWNENKKFIGRETFMAKFAQSVSKAIAIQSVKKTYDAIVLLRTDLFLDPKKYFVYGDIFHNLKKIKKDTKRIILTSYIRLSTKNSGGVDDKLWISTQEDLELYFSNYKEKINKFIQNYEYDYITPENISAHIVACNLSKGYEQDEIWFLPFYDIFKYLTPLSRITFTNLFKIVRNYEDVQEMIKNPNFTIEDYKQLTK